MDIDTIQNTKKTSKTNIDIDTNSSKNFKHTAQEVLRIEADALHKLIQTIDDSYVQACELIAHTSGKTIIIGMGKSGLIGQKIAATFASTGTPSFFVHPGEASHGDIGMISKNDVVVLISFSGETEEVLSILPVLKYLGVPCIGITGNPRSSIAQHAQTHLYVDIEEEACPLGLAPTTSTTATLAIGDALAIAVHKYKGFTSKDFAFSHPAGSLGRRLLLTVESIMHTGDRIPTVKKNTTIADVLVTMTEKQLGMVVILGETNEMIGIFTDGDLRRILSDGINIHHTLITNVMQSKFTTIHKDTLAIDAFNTMQKHKINGLIVLNKEKQPIGAFNHHDLLNAGIV